MRERENIVIGDCGEIYVIKCSIYLQPTSFFHQIDIIYHSHINIYKTS